jgi:hypothetical protein
LIPILDSTGETSDYPNVPKRIKIALVAGVFALVGIIAWQLLLPLPRDPDLVYEGKPLSSWLNAAWSWIPLGDYPERTWLPPAYPFGLAPDQQMAVNTVRQVGTNALPTLFRMLRAKDSALRLKLLTWVDWQRLIKIDPKSAANQNLAARFAFEVLGGTAQTAVPTLIEIADGNISPTSRACAIESLGFIGPSAREAIPALLGWTTNADLGVRYRAILSLGRIHSEADRVVPVLIEGLRGQGPVRWSAAWALGEFGGDAKMAVPALVELRNTSDSVLRGCVNNALKAIDPEAATKAGITRGADH